MAKLKSVTGVEFDPPMPPGRRALAGSKAAQTRSHSIRTSHDLWRALVAVAKRDGHTPSYVITLLVVGYVQGKIALPRMEMVWDDSPAEPS